MAFFFSGDVDTVEDGGFLLSLSLSLSSLLPRRARDREGSTARLLVKEQGHLFRLIAQNNVELA